MTTNSGEPPLSPKQVLLAELARLKEVSARNEALTKTLAAAETPSPALQAEIDSCVAEQSRIVDTFVQHCRDSQLLARFQGIVLDIERLVAALETMKEPAEIAAAKEQILRGVEAWIAGLEEIITSVISQADSAQTQ